MANLTSYDDLVNNNIDYTYHHATLGHKSWLDHMFITDLMKQLVCNFTIVDSATVDASKAFDRMDHKVLFQKLVIVVHRVVLLGF